MSTLVSSVDVPVAPSSGEVVIEFKDVELGFDQHLVLRGVSFRLHRGETKVLFGVAGSGKSLILKLALGLLKPDAGTIVVLGEEVTSMPEEELFKLRRRIGMVFQESALFDSFTVEENVGYRLFEEHAPQDEVHRRVLEALTFVELANTVNKFPAELSGGMRRRVAIARAIITQPEIILYDSPTGGLDPITSTTIVELLIKQRDVYHTSSLMVTHRLQDGFVMATHIYDQQRNEMVPVKGSSVDTKTTFLILRDGKVIFNGTAHELRQTTDEYIKEYIS
jgi:phospholipid/cholesterol/gamma-HCH transport system ATP-binding protein